MLTSSVKRITFACKLLLLIAGLTMAPIGADAARIYIDSDYSETFYNDHGIRACDNTSGTGTAYSRYGFDDTETQRLDTQGNPSCAEHVFASDTIYKHKICQAKPWDDPCSDYVYE